MNKKITELMGNYEFCEKLTKAESKDEVKELFKQHGVDISSEEIDSLETFMSSLESELEKLDIEQLKAISGGKKQGPTGKKDNNKNENTEQSIWTLDNFGKVLDLLKAPASGLLNYFSEQNQAKLDAKITETQIKEEAETKRNDKIMTTLAGAAVVAAIAGSIYFSRPIKKWWKGN